MLYGWVALGSILGGLARYFVSLLLDTGPGLPWATLFINVTGSLIIGFYATLTGPDGRLLARPEHRQFVMTGFCGGYTTFSTFSLETFRLFHAGMKYTALAYIGASVIGWLAAVWLGHMGANRYNRLKRS
jgi:CrcB protein